MNTNPNNASAASTTKPDNKPAKPIANSDPQDVGMEDLDKLPPCVTRPVLGEYTVKLPDGRLLR